MDTYNLRQLQQPLKEKYKNDPDAAKITLKASSRIGEGITCRIETGKMLAEAGLHPATGGDGISACSGDMLLEALAACAGVTLKAVATSIDFSLQDAHIEAAGDLDFRGTLAIDKTVPVGFKEIRLNFNLVTPETPEKIASLIGLTERYCVVYQTLIQKNTIQVSVN